MRPSEVRSRPPSSWSLPEQGGAETRARIVPVAIAHSSPFRGAFDFMQSMYAEMTIVSAAAETLLENPRSLVVAAGEPFCENTAGGVPCSG